MMSFKCNICAHYEKWMGMGNILAGFGEWEKPGDMFYRHAWWRKKKSATLKSQENTLTTGFLSGMSKEGQPFWIWGQALAGASNLRYEIKLSQLDMTSCCYCFSFSFLHCTIVKTVFISYAENQRGRQQRWNISIDLYFKNPIFLLPLKGKDSSEEASFNMFFCRHSPHPHPPLFWVEVARSTPFVFQNDTIFIRDCMIQMLLITCLIMFYDYGNTSFGSLWSPSHKNTSLCKEKWESL